MTEDAGQDADATDDVDNSGDERPDKDSARTPRSRGRSLRLAGWGLLALLVVGLAWVIVTGIVARSKLESARDDIGALRRAVLAGDVERADDLVASIHDKTASAHALTSGPAWWVGSNIPGLGTPLRTSRVIAAQADRLGSDVLPGVLRLARTVPARSDDPLTSVDLTAVAAAEPELRRAARTASEAAAEIAAADPSWLPLVSSAREDVVGEVGRLGGELTGANRALRIAVPMLGKDSPQRYFIGFMNEAESRGGGGLPGAFAIATVSRGRVTFEHFGSDDELRGVRAKVNLGQEIESRYSGSDITGTIQNSNLSPDFSVAARIWAGMWQAKSGERVDGAIAIDPTALSYLLRTTGYARIPGPGMRVVSSRTVVALTMKQQYSLYPGLSAEQKTDRKQFLIGLARAISDKLQDAGKPAELVKALSRAASERRLLVWSADAGLEKQLQDVGWGGTLGNDRGTPYSGFVVNNAAGSKLDYYLDRSMTYRRTDCASGGESVATITLTNTAPRSGLPPYVTIRADGAPAGARPGDNKVLLTYYASRNADVRTLAVDGKPVDFALQPEGDTVAVTVGVELPAGTPVTVRVTTKEPAADGPVDLLRQPLARPLTVDLRGDRCR